jgi:hypothetical protein
MVIGRFRALSGKLLNNVARLKCDISSCKLVDHHFHPLENVDVLRTAIHRAMVNYYQLL